MSQLKLDLSYYFDNIKARSKSIQGAVEQASNQKSVNPIPHANALARDLFNSLYQVHPQIVKSREPNKYNEVLRAVAKSEGFKKLRKDTINQLSWSSIGAAIILDELQKSGENFKGEKYPQSGDGSDGENPGNEPGDSNQNGDGDQASDGISQAIENAAERMEEMMEGLAPGNKGAIPTFDKSVEQTERIAQLLKNRYVSDFFKRIGKLRMASNFLPALDIGDPVEITSIETGRDLQKVLPQDLIWAAGDDEEFAVFAEKYTNHELLQFQTKSPKRSGEGPMIVCIDNSSSMHSMDRIEWAKAIAGAAYLHALKKKRPFAAIVFNYQAFMYEPKTQGVLDVEFLNKLASIGAHGGTSFEAPWQKAMEMIRKQTNKNTWRKADVVFITDGYASISSDWSKEKAKYSVRLFSFFVGMTPESLEQQGYNELASYSDMANAMPIIDADTATSVASIITTSKKQKRI